MAAYGETPSMVLPLMVLGFVTLLYLSAATSLARRATRGWSAWRTGSWALGAMLLALGLLPQYLPFSHHDLRQHMMQHLLLGMLAPLALVMSAPVTLFLRTAPRPVARAIVRLLRSGAVRILANPATALTVNLGGMAAIYFTPLYAATMARPSLHYLVHFHFVAAGCLYVWVIAGPDPAPHRPSVPRRLVVLGVAVVLHSVMAQMLYAGWYVAVPGTPEQRHQAAELMYYGGDIAEMLLAFSMVSGWRPKCLVAVAGGAPKMTDCTPAGR